MAEFESHDEPIIFDEIYSASRNRGGGSAALHRIEKILQEAPTQANARDLLERTPLHLAARMHIPWLVKLLFQYGADPNAHDENQETPLHAAINQDFEEEPDVLVEVVELLLQNGANSSLADAGGRTPLFLASGYALHRVARAIEGEGTQLDLNSAINQGRVERVRELLEAGSEAVRSAPRPDELLSDALLLRDRASLRSTMLPIISLLLEHGVDVNQHAPERMPPLWEACTGGTPLPVIGLLLDHGADVNVDFNGKTPLDLARENKALARLLRSAGATSAQPVKTAAPRALRSLTTHQGLITHLVFCPDGRVIASAGEDETVKLWEASTGKLLGTLPGQGEVTSALAFAPNGRTLAAGGTTGRVRLWNTGQSKLDRTLSAHTASVTSLAFDRGGGMLASAGQDVRVLLWNMPSGKQLIALGKGEEGGNYPLAVAFAPDGMTLAISDGLTPEEEAVVTLWDIRRQQVRATLPSAGGPVLGLAFSADGSTLVGGDWNGRLLIWDVATGQQRLNLRAGEGPVGSVGLTPDARVVITAGSDGLVRFWDGATGVVRLELRGKGGVTAHGPAVALSPDGQLVAVGCSGGTVKLWKLSKILSK